MRAGQNLTSQNAPESTIGDGGGVLRPPKAVPWCQAYASMPIDVDGIIRAPGSPHGALFRPVGQLWTDGWPAGLCFSLH
jgi:hypothetical protein